MVYLLRVVASAKWKATGKFLSSMAGDCTAILMYTANLIKAGYVTFEYQFTDESSIFEFIVSLSFLFSIWIHVMP